MSLAMGNKLFTDKRVCSWQLYVYIYIFINKKNICMLRADQFLRLLKIQQAALLFVSFS